ncbi:hypothetical protein [Amycolatopsis vancoresmycina]|uniref:Uncharacterized protein n=1 Tax=Amycolatopsis vancoresmycina DSM 44592 TaxID=1292037 RepID=R1I901_9PSEU|nr:hypothetical protein [Amycolatopsis vancoresmycina]EOD66889.1 hypothetical protein H480_19238 [Amycolatopsis vancoresmycina DSM 44592]
MTTTAHTADIEALFVRAEAAPGKCDASGTVYQTSQRVINGHMVQVYAVGWDLKTAARFVNVDRSTERLTIEQAAERIAA